MILKGKLKNSTRGIVLRKALVVVQFMTSVALIAGTFIAFRQLNYMMSKDIGVTIDQVLVVERPGVLPRRSEDITSAIDVFRNELKKSPTIQAGLPLGCTRHATGLGQRSQSATAHSTISWCPSAPTAWTTEFMRRKHGTAAGRPRLFARAYLRPGYRVVYSLHRAVKQLGFKDPEAAIGQTITIPEWSSTSIIVGVVNDYHQVSLKQSMIPIVFYCTEYDGEYYAMHINTQDLPATIDHVKAAWEKSFPGNPFDYFFLDDYFNRQYKNERQFGLLFTTFAVLALLIGCLGLFGLSAYTATQRTKEIGIRKALGSSEAGIFMLSRANTSGWCCWLPCWVCPSYTS